MECLRDLKGPEVHAFQIPLVSCLSLDPKGGMRAILRRASHSSSAHDKTPPSRAFTRFACQGTELRLTFAFVTDGTNEKKFSLRHLDEVCFNDAVLVTHLHKLNATHAGGPCYPLLWSCLRWRWLFVCVCVL